ncbi:unnamed protein product [Nyctereutes procyonoides]|uniref:(raccoon dog) hypothetical protein n=1 Tax=Nyctereutes procyonoides TaxID=34880 RepID=A0A811Y005_NYCPR|nr:unnamed protein product [Nyctereutes procyonoides]
MSLRSLVSGRLAQLRAAEQLLRVPRPWPGPSAGATRTRSGACGSPGDPGRGRPRRADPSGSWGLGGGGGGAERRAGVRTWAPLAMAAKVDLSTSTDWKEAKSFLKGLTDKQREEHYFCRDFIRLKKIPTWKEMAKANSSLLGGGGVDGCIHRAAGPLLTDECRTLQSCETGKAKITGGYRLPAKYVIHTVGPIAHGEPSASQATELRSCYLSSLDLLLEHRLRSAAFPCISTGVFGYPSEAAAEVVLAALREWLEQHKDKVDRLIICVFLEKDESIYLQRLPHYFPVDSPGPTGPRSQL